MPLWGATDSDESKPKNLTTAQKKQVFANASGWVLEAGSALSLIHISAPTRPY